MAENYKDQPDKLPITLWGYQTSIQSSIVATRYSLVHGIKAVLRIKIAIPSLRAIAKVQIPESEWVKAWYKELIMLYERPLWAFTMFNCINLECQAFNKKAKPRDLREGDIVLNEIKALIHDTGGKLRPYWLGPFIIKTILPRGDVKLINLDRKEYDQYTNLDLKKHYA